MKNGLAHLIVAAAIAATALGPAASCARASLEVAPGARIGSSADFYEALAEIGSWVQVTPYGRCWRPAHRTDGWRPYANGNWVWTDCGWYWKSAEPWAWACYHYGSWTLDTNEGWIWVPGVAWAPAWVCWRVGPIHVGWAPCAPGGHAPASTAFVFVNAAHFRDPQTPDTVISDDPDFINQTAPVAGNQRESRTVAGRPQTILVNHGPTISFIEKASGQRFSAVPIDEIRQPAAGPAPKANVAGGNHP